MELNSFFNTLFDMGNDVRILGHLKFACIGPSTKQCLKDYGIISDVLPKTYMAEGLIDSFSNICMKNKRVLLPRAKEARTVLSEKLTLMGAKVDEVTAYETCLNSEGNKELISLLEKKQINAITFTSSSTVINFMSLLESKNINNLLKNVILTSIGPVTSRTIKFFNLEPDIEANQYTIQGLVDSLLAFYKIKN